MQHPQPDLGHSPFRLALMMAMLMTALTPTSTGFAQDASGQESPGDKGRQLPPTTPRIDWALVNPREQETITRLLNTDDWPLRVFALLRLERYAGDAVDELVRQRFKDTAWQVRCFALRQAVQLGISVTTADFQDETEPLVVRAALRAGVQLDEAFVITGTKRLMRQRNVDQLLLGLEIAAASDIEVLREEATRRCTRFITKMNDSIRIRVSRRLARIVGLPREPSNVKQWQTWYKSNQKTFTIAPPVSETGPQIQPVNSLAGMEQDTFSRLMDYLNFLRQRSLEIAVVMDFTYSMTPMINQARAGIDALIIFLNDISRSMQLGFVAYRDHDNKPVFERHAFTRNVESVRDFLFNVRVTGGADFPEAVLDGLTACAELEWSGAASRQIILVGDAPPHEEDLYKLMNLVDEYRSDDIIVHAVHVPMQRGFYRVPDEWIDNYNTSTGQIFADIAYRGGGRKIELTDAEQLVPSVMHFTLEENWWPVFDEFYRLYLDSCR